MLAKRSAAGKEGKIVRGAASAVIDLFFSIWEGGGVKNGKNTEAICRLHRQRGVNPFFLDKIHDISALEK